MMRKKNTPKVSTDPTKVLYCDVNRCNQRWISQEDESIEDTVRAATVAGWIIVLPGHRCPRHA